MADMLEVWLATKQPTQNYIQGGVCMRSMTVLALR